MLSRVVAFSLCLWCAGGRLCQRLHRCRLQPSIKLGFVLLATILPVTTPLILTTVLAVGAQELAKDNAVVQRFRAIPEMANMDILCSDKTGILTLGKMKCQ